MTKPKTEAGRALIEEIWEGHLDTILAIEAEAVKPWREALSAAMTHYEGSLAECGCEVATRARALLDEADHD